MSNRAKAILLVVIGILIIGFLLFMLRNILPSATVDVGEELGFGGNVIKISDVPLVDAPVQVASNTADGSPAPTLVESNVESELSRVAASFVERFGSYSSDSSFENITDLQSSMTDNMRNWSNTYIESLNAQYANAAEFYGVETRSLSVKINSLDKQKGLADFTVVTQRSEINGKNPAVVKYQEFSIKMILVGGAWKVDFGKWL